MRVATDGELLARGAHLFAGYWHNDEATATTIDSDGWLHTGDLATIDDDGYVTITGRKKDIIITAGGKNIAPANLENELRQSRWISHAIMLGDRRPYRSPSSPSTRTRSSPGPPRTPSPPTFPPSPPTPTSGP